MSRPDWDNQFSETNPMTQPHQIPLPSKKEAYERYMALLAASSPVHRTNAQREEIDRAEAIASIAKMREG